MHIEWNRNNWLNIKVPAVNDFVKYINQFKHFAPGLWVRSPNFFWYTDGGN